MRAYIRTHQSLSLWVAIAIATAACSSKDQGTGTSAGDTNQSATTAAGTGGQLSSTATGLGFGGSLSSGEGGAGGGGGACLATSQVGKKRPLDIVLLLDRSLTMKGSQWDGATKAMIDFVTDPKVTNTAFGVNFYPASNAPKECNVALYNPAQIPLTALPGGAMTLVTAIQSKKPEGYDTPTHSAMYGSLLYAQKYQDDNPTHKVVVVLATDGQVNSCNTNIGDIADLAKQAFQYNGILTFAVAINGADLKTLDPIAAAGGTGKPIDITTDITKLKSTLEQIRLDVLGCEYAIPAPMMGQQFDPKKLNINYTMGGSMTPTTIPQAKDVTKCGNMPGWYYDNNLKPTKILFCPQTCAQLKKDPGAKVEFAFGCPTVVNDPK
jgi:hypothetical protein